MAAEMTPPPLGRGGGDRARIGGVTVTDSLLVSRLFHSHLEDRLSLQASPPGPGPGRPVPDMTSRQQRPLEHPVTAARGLDVLDRGHGGLLSWSFAGLALRCPFATWMPAEHRSLCVLFSSISAWEPGSRGQPRFQRSGRRSDAPDDSLPGVASADCGTLSSAATSAAIRSARCDGSSSPLPARATGRGSRPPARPARWAVRIDFEFLARDLRRR